MNPILLRRHPRFFAALGGVLLLGALGAWRVASELRLAAVAEQRLHAKQQERDFLQTTTPRANAATTERLAAAEASARAELKRRQDAWQGEWLPAGTAEAPRDRTEAFFELAVAVERMRANLLTRGIELRPEEYFGFASYRQTGPDSELIAAVRGQRRVVEALMEALGEARPAGLLAVQRQRPLVGAPRGIAAEMTADYFAPDPRWALQQVAGAPTLAIRVAFSGDTPVLRKFLNRLAADGQPLAVRLIEAEPLAAGELTAKQSARVVTGREQEGAPVTIVAPGLLRFVVTVETPVAAVAAGEERP
jgi:hypothetical protein